VENSKILYLLFFGVRSPVLGGDRGGEVSGAGSHQAGNARESLVGAAQPLIIGHHVDGDLAEEAGPLGQAVIGVGRHCGGRGPRCGLCSCGQVKAWGRGSQCWHVDMNVVEQVPAGGSGGTEENKD
jgi:hypothetical protein